MYPYQEDHFTRTNDGRLEDPMPSLPKATKVKLQPINEVYEDNDKELVKERLVTEKIVDNGFLTLKIKEKLYVFKVMEIEAQLSQEYLAKILDLKNSSVISKNLTVNDLNSSNHPGFRVTPDVEVEITS